MLLTVPRAAMFSLTAWLAFAASGPGQAQPAPASPTPASPIGSGPYPAVMEVEPNLPTHTVYRPKDLAAAPSPLPIVVWGNGACVNLGNRFRWFLSEIASYGYVTIAIGPIGPSQVETVAALTPQPSPKDPPGSHSGQLIDAINWAVAENQRAGSPFFHRLDTSKIAVMGQSCGGVQAIEASADPRVTTSVIWNSGLFQHPTDMAGGKTMTKADLAKLHAPIAYIGGDPQDVSFPNANDDYAQITAVPAFRGWERGVPHVGPYRERDGGEFGGVAVAWLNWRLKGDAKAGRMFVGADCGLCVNPRWVVSSKGF